MATTHVTGSIHMGNVPALHQVRDVSRTLARCYPWAGPLTTILMNLKGGTIKGKQDKFEWETKSPMPHLDTALQNSTAGASASEIKLRVGNGPQWALHDVVTLLDDNAYAYDLIVTQIGTNSGDVEIYLQAFSESAFPTAPSITAADRILRVGVAYPEESGDSTPRATYPGLEYNYHQIHAAFVSISETKRATKNYTVQDWQEGRNDALFRYRLDLDSSYFFGKRSKTTHTGADGRVRDRRTMGGTASYITTNQLTYVKGALTEVALMNWAKTIFSQSSGSPDRFLFTDAELQSEIDQILLTSAGSNSEVRTNRKLMDNVAKLGIKVREICSTFGNLYMIYVPAFNYRGISHYGQILDVKDLKRIVLRPMYTMLRSERETGVDGKELRIKEESCLAMGCESFHAEIRGTDT